MASAVAAVNQLAVLLQVPVRQSCLMHSEMLWLTVVIHRVLYCYSAATAVLLHVDAAGGVAAVCCGFFLATPL